MRIFKLFLICFLMTGCTRFNQPECLNPPHEYTKWSDKEYGNTLDGHPSIKQTRHCKKCGLAEISWHR